MKLIDVFNMLAERKIKKGTKLIIVTPSGKEYEYEYAIDIHDGTWSFVDDYDRGISCMFDITADTLQYEVKLVEGKEKEYLIKVNVQGLDEDFAYVNYFKRTNYVVLNFKYDNKDKTRKTHFTKQEMQTLEPVRKFLADMSGKYELIEHEWGEE